jgi:ribosomal protein L3 glutamine methyltransferase
MPRFARLVPELISGTCMPQSKNHSTDTQRSRLTVARCIELGSKRFVAAELSFGHGTDNAVDEAAELVFFAAGLRHEDSARVYGQELTDEQRLKIESLFARRIAERVPAAYLTQRMWFAGHEFYVDERVLVPRSPIAELIEARFEPWIGADRIRSVLDIGTGSGCIAIASALTLPNAQIDAADISLDALAVTRINIERHGLGNRVHPVESDVYSNLGNKTYDVIVTNPPYVGREELDSLPEEYRREPELGLFGGEDGLNIVRRIFAGAAAHLERRGILIGEVGNTEMTLNAAFPDVPFIWLEFERGGGGVFVLNREDLVPLSAAPQR